MKIAVVGGGPAGLYFALLMKRKDPRHDITVYERNKPDDTFGFGVVFSDETLAGFRDADEKSFRDITASFAYWDKIEVRFGGKALVSGGHGFCGMSRKELLLILQRHCRDAGVELKFKTDIASLDRFADCDLILASDGINSFVREGMKEHFQPSVDWRKNKFIWLGTTKPLSAFTFVFKNNEHGIWNVHAYRFNSELTTWIVETTEETWRKAGMDKASEEQSVAYLEKLYAKELDGHRLLTNRSIWRTFPTIKCGHWVHRNIALAGDAAHTAHFSIGSGTKLAMEDAIALFQACQRHSKVADALAAYEKQRIEEAGRLQTTAKTSLEWYENVARYFDMEPEQLTFSMMSRSKRVTYDNLKLRDPAYGASIDRWFAAKVAREQKIDLPLDAPPPPMFAPLRLRGMTLDNRVVVSPMCQYSAKDGLPDDWHLVHLGARAIGGAGLVYAEMTGISEDARITPGCAGIYRKEHVEAWRRIVAFVRANSRAKIALQLGHAGRKGATCIPWEGGYDQPLPKGAWPLLSASAIPYLPKGQVPKAMNRADMDRTTADYVRAAGYAQRAGFDMIEVHMAHGYLLSSFISPLTNRRNDEYGGDLAGRMRYPLEVFDAVRKVWPKDMPMSVRISATDWVEPDGLSADDAVEIAKMLKAHGCDIVDVSAGQTVLEAKPQYGRMYQTPFSDQIRQEAGIATMAVGAITDADQVNTIVAAGRADLVALARPHLADPYFTLHAASTYGRREQFWPPQYLAGRDQALGLAARWRAEMGELRAAAKPPSYKDGA